MLRDGRKDDWHLKSFSTVFQLYQKDGMNERLCATEPSLQLERFGPQAGIEPGTIRLACQNLTQCATGTFLFAKGGN